MSLVESFCPRGFYWKEIGLTPSTPSWYGIHTGAHALPRPFFFVSTTLEIVFVTTSWHRVLIQACVSVGTFSVIFTYI